MKRSSVQKFRNFFQNQVGHFLANQLMHTVITAVILIGFFFRRSAGRRFGQRTRTRHSDHG